MHYEKSLRTLAICVVDGALTELREKTGVGGDDTFILNMLNLR